MCFSFAVLCGVSLVYSFFRFLSFLSPVSCHSLLCQRFLHLSSLAALPVVSVVSLSLVLFLVVCKGSVFALALLLSLVVVLCAPDTFFPLWVSFTFSSLVYLAYSLLLFFLLSFAILSLFSGGSPYVAFALFLPYLGLCLRFSRCFLSFHHLCARMCVVSYSSLFLLPFHLVSLASGISCLP